MRWSEAADPRNRESRSRVGVDGRCGAARTSCRNGAGRRGGCGHNLRVFRATASRTGRGGERRGDESVTAMDSGFVPPRSRGEVVDLPQISRAGVATLGGRASRSRGFRPETGRWRAAVDASPLGAIERVRGRAGTAPSFTLGAKRERSGDESRECQMFARRSLEIWWTEPRSPRDVEATGIAAGSAIGAASTSAYRNDTDRSRAHVAAAGERGGAGAGRRGGVHAGKTAGTERRRIADRPSFPLSFSRDVGGGGAADARSAHRPAVASGRWGRRVHLSVPRWDGGVSGRRAGRSRRW